MLIFTPWVSHVRSFILPILFCLILAPSVKAQDEYAVRLGAGHDIGSGIGYADSFSTLEMFAPLAGNNDGLWFLDGRLMLNNDTKGGGMFGVGRRTALSDQVVLGANLYYDVRDTGASTFQQLGAGVELLTDWFEVRSNYYSPDLADTRDELDSRLRGTSLLVNRAEVAMRGVDVEAGITLPAMLNTQSRLFGGMYHFEGSGAEEVTGWKARAEVNLPHGITVDTTVQDDDVFGTTVIVGLAFRWVQPFQPIGPQPRYQSVDTFRTGRRAHISRSARDRLADPVERLQNIVVSTDEGEPAIDPVTGGVLNILNVSAAGSTSGDGSFENPFQTFAQALADSRAQNGIIYTPQGGDFAEDLTLLPGTQLLSNGPEQFVQTHLGMQMLPQSGVRLDVNNPTARITGDITLADRNIVDGFGITGGITGNGVNSARISRNRISNLIGNGVLLDGVNNAGDRIEIEGNVITASGLNGINVDGTTVNVDVMNNVVSDQILGGVLISSVDYTGTISGNTANSNILTGISVSGSNSLAATITNNTANENLLAGILVSGTGDFSGSITNNITNGNQGTGAVQVGGITVVTSSFAGNISNNMANMNLIPGILVATNDFTGDIVANSTSTNALGGIGVAATTFTGNITDNTTTLSPVNGILLAVGQMNGAITGNNATANLMEGVQVFFGGANTSDVNFSNNVLLGNNTGTEREVFFQNTGDGTVNLQLIGNNSLNQVTAGSFNFDLSNTGMGTLSTAPPQRNLGTVGSSDGTVTLP